MAEKKHGGARKGAGRPSKGDEEKQKSLSLRAVVNIFGSEEMAFDHLAKIAKTGDYKHLALLFEYAFGKPKEYKAIEVSGTFDLESAVKTFMSEGDE